MPGKMKYPWLPLFAADFVAIVAAYYTALLLRFHSDTGARLYAWISAVLFDIPAGVPGDVLERFYIISAPRIITIMASAICILYAINNLYAERRHILPRPTTWLIIVSNLCALLIFYTYFYLTRNVFHPRSLFASVIVFNIGYCGLLRGLLARIREAARRRYGFDCLTALMVGDSPQVKPLTAYIESEHPAGLTRVVRLTDWPGADFVAALDRLRQAATAGQVDVLICATPDLTVDRIMQVLAVAESLGLPAKILSSELAVLPNHARLPTDRIGGIPLVHFDAPRHGGRLGPVRRIITWLLAAAALLVLAPLMLVIAVAIRVAGSGPVLFTQERIGFNRKPFRICKFRTMHEGAEEQQSEIEAFNEHADAALFKMRNDPRITPVGRFLRRFSLDELPQLFNVLRGEMVLVGPRPLPRRDFENYYADWHYTRHGGLPGLTCLWQVSGRSDLDFHHMCLLDIYYLRNHTWVLDLKIALRTAWSVIFAKGAY